MRWRCAVAMGLLLCWGACTKPLDEAEEYYRTEKFDIAARLANKAFAANPSDLRATVLLWKVQIATSNCGVQALVERAYAAVREKVTAAGEGIIPPLAAALEDPRGCVRLFAVYALGDVRSPQVPPLLVRVMRGGLPPMAKPGRIGPAILRGEAALTLGRRQAREALPDLVAACKDTSGTVRVRAAEALGILGDLGAVPALRALLEDPYEVASQKVVAQAAAKALRDLTGEEPPAK